VRQWVRRWLRYWNRHRMVEEEEEAVAGVVVQGVPGTIVDVYDRTIAMVKAAAVSGDTDGV
jgi:hypothetical protein